MPSLSTIKEEVHFHPWVIKCALQVPSICFHAFEHVFHPQSEKLQMEGIEKLTGLSGQVCGAACSKKCLSCTAFVWLSIHMFWNSEVSSLSRWFSVQCLQYNTHPFETPFTHFFRHGTCNTSSNHNEKPAAQHDYVCETHANPTKLTPKHSMPRVNPQRLHDATRLSQLASTQRSLRSLCEGWVMCTAVSK